MVKVNVMQFYARERNGRCSVYFEVTRGEECLYMCFVDLEKTFDRVPRKVVE